MKANEFVKKYGLELSREIVSKKPKWANNVRVSEITGTWEYTEKVLPSFSIDDLKRLVESHELTFLFGDDISYAKKYLKEMLFKFREDMEFYVEDDCRSYSLLELKQAIADVEACMGEG